MYVHGENEMKQMWQNCDQLGELGEGCMSVQCIHLFNFIVDLNFFLSKKL